jgi:hypothetical protein
MIRKILILVAVLCCASVFVAANGLTVIAPSTWTVTQVSPSTVQLRPNNIAGWPNDAYIQITGSGILDFTVEGNVLSASYVSGKPKLAISMANMPSGIGWLVHLPEYINKVTACASQPCLDKSKAVILEIPNTVTVVDMYDNPVTIESYFDIYNKINIEMKYDENTYVPLGEVEGEGGDDIPEFDIVPVGFALVALAVLLIIFKGK